MSEENPIIVGLDIGTTKVVAIVGQKNEHGKIKILGHGKSNSYGVTRGVVHNIDLTVQAIREAVEMAENSSGVEIKNVYVGIAGQHIRSLQHHDMMTRKSPDEEISHKEIEEMTEQVFNLLVNPGEEIIHAIPQEYKIDYESGIKNPVGMCGQKVEANFHIITGQVTAAKNIYRCVSRADLHAVDLILEPLASSEAVLDEKEKEAGVVLVDIGGGTTDIAIFQDGIIRHTAVIALGGDIITEDIKEGCSIIKDYAEILKVRFGSALASESKEYEIVSIPGLRGREPKEISLKNLAHIIQARMEDIIEHVFYEIRNSGYEKKLSAGIVVTGGGSMLKNTNLLMQYLTGMDTRLGYPNEHLAPGYEEITKPIYSTGIGLVIKGFEDIERKRLRNLPLKDKDVPKPAKPEGGILDRFKKHAKDWFLND